MTRLRIPRIEGRDNQFALLLPGLAQIDRAGAAVDVCCFARRAVPAATRFDARHRCAEVEKLGGVERDTSTTATARLAIMIVVVATVRGDRCAGTEANLCSLQVDATA